MQDLHAAEAMDQADMRLLTDAECDDVNGGFIFVLALAAGAGWGIGTAVYNWLN